MWAFFAKGFLKIKHHSAHLKESCSSPLCYSFPFLFSIWRYDRYGTNYVCLTAKHPGLIKHTKHVLLHYWTTHYLPYKEKMMDSPFKTCTNLNMQNKSVCRRKPDRAHAQPTFIKFGASATKIGSLHGDGVRGQNIRTETPISIA